MRCADAELGLGESCDSDDVCADPSAQCRAGRCQCQDDYYVTTDNRCGNHSNSISNVVIGVERSVRSISFLFHYAYSVDAYSGSESTNLKVTLIEPKEFYLLFFSKCTRRI